MKTPLVIVLVIVAGMLGFLTIYSQQHEMSVASQEQGSPGGESGAAAPAAAPAAPVTPPAAGGYGAAAPSPAPAAGGYGK